MLTKLQLEHSDYKKLIIRDVNNYIAIGTDNKVKCKGAFEWEDLNKKKVSVLHKNKSFLIIPKAIYAYFVKGISPEEFLRNNQDIMDYCAGVKSKGQYYFESHIVEKGELKTSRLQRIIRYFISNDGSKIVKRNPDGRGIQIEFG